MGDEETKKSLLQGGFWDVGLIPERVSSGSKKEREGGGGYQTGEPDRREYDARKQQAGEGEDREEQRKTPSEASNWDRVVDLIQTTFVEGQMAEDATWQAVVLIPKGEEE